MNTLLYTLGNYPRRSPVLAPLRSIAPVPKRKILFELSEHYKLSWFDIVELVFSLELNTYDVARQFRIHPALVHSLQVLLTEQKTIVRPEVVEFLQARILEELSRE